MVGKISKVSAEVTGKYSCLNSTQSIKKQRHFLIVTSEKSGFAKYLTCSASLDQKLPVFFDPNNLIPDGGFMY